MTAEVAPDDKSPPLIVTCLHLGPRYETKRTRELERILIDLESANKEMGETWPRWVE